jgi:hypothetical protein
MTDTTAGDPDGQSRSVTLSDQERYRLLSDERRRHAADVLADRSSAMSLRELATAISARERGHGGESEHTLEVRLHHVHLPMMADAGVLTYDVDANRVEPRPARLEALTE